MISDTQSSNTVYILNADPQNPEVVAKINLGNDTEPAGLFLSQDGSKLVVLASKYQYLQLRQWNYAPYPVGTNGGVAMPMLAAYHADVYTFINVYDVTNKANPVLDRNFTVSGSYFNSRMIGNYVYAVVSQPATVNNNDVTLPAVYNGKAETNVPPSSIYYADMVEPSYFTYTSFFGINILDDTPAANQHDCHDGWSQHNVRFPKQHVRNLPNLDKRRTIHCTFIKSA